MLKLLRGIGIPAAWAGLARGVVEAFVIGGLVAVGTALPNMDLGDMAWTVPFLLAGIRFAEGIADGIDPSKPRAP
jgi:hypothetical protein